MIGAHGRIWLRLLHQRRNFLQTPSFCTDAQSTSSSLAKKNSNDVVAAAAADERYRQLENLDMVTAAKILFSDPPKKKEFGFDFHLVQFFFACLPSLAVYLVAQYARYDIKKMEAEVEQKKKQRDEEEAKKKDKEMELNPSEEKEAKPDPDLVEVKVRLDKLEECLKEIVVESKKQSNTNLTKNQVIDGEKKHTNSSAPSSQSNSPKSKTELGEECKSSTETPSSSSQGPKSQNQ